MSVVTSYKSPTAASGTNWTNPTNVYSSNDTRAQYANSAQDNLYVTGFDFSDIPTWSTIMWVEVQVEGNGASGTAANRSIKVGMTKNGSTQAGSFLASQNLPQTTDGTRTYGSATNLFSTTLTLAELQASTRWVILATNNTNTSARNIDYVQVRVYYAPPVSQLSDNFNDNSVDTAIWDDWSWGKAVETSQQMQISTVTAANYYGIDSLTEYNLTDGYVSVEIVDVANQTQTSLEFYPLYLFPDANNSIFFLVSWGNIRAYKKISGTNTALGSAQTFNSTTHKYVRIRESGGTTYREYSSNGTSWSTLHSVANPIAVTKLIVELLIWHYAVEAAATTGKWDNLNVLPSASRRVFVVS